MMVARPFIGLSCIVLRFFASFFVHTIHVQLNSNFCVYMLSVEKYQIKIGSVVH